MSTATLNFHIQDKSNGQYKTSSGWSSDISSAQLLSNDRKSPLYWGSVLNSLPSGEYIVIDVYLIST